MKVAKGTLFELLDDINRRLNGKRRLMIYATGGSGYVALVLGNGGHWQISPSGSRRELYFWLRGFAYLLLAGEE